MIRRLFPLLLLLLLSTAPFLLAAQSVPRTIRSQWYAGRRYVSVSDVARFTE